MQRVISVVIGVMVAAMIAAGQTAVKEIQGGILNGKAVSLPKPDYPDYLKAAGIEGTIFVDVVIDEDGNVISAVAASKPRMLPISRDEKEDVPVADPILRSAAEEAALKASFSPTMLNGVPVKVKGTIVYVFRAGASQTPRSSDEAAKMISGSVLNGKAVNLPMPVYPAAAAAVRAEGAVTVRVTVNEEGNVVEAEAVAGHPLLRTSAAEAARAARFSPTLLNGQPVRISGVLVYNFTAGQKDPQ